MAGVKGVDIDAIFTALRPRILGLFTGGSGVTRVGPQGPAGPKGVTWRGAWAADTDYATGDLVTYLTAGSATLTYICIEANTSVGGSPPTVGGDERWHELGPGYLIIDGSRAMTGDLDLDAHSVVDQIAARFVPTVVPGTEYTAAEGDVSWDASTLLGQLVMHGASDGGLVKLPGLGTYVKVRNYNHPTSSAIAIGTVVKIGGGPGTHVTATEFDPVYHDYINEGNGIGLMVTPAPNDGTGWACVEGLAFGIDTSAFAANDKLCWVAPSLAVASGVSVPLKGSPHIFVGRVVLAAVAGVVYVQFDWRPDLDDLANVEGGADPYDVLVWAEGEGGVSLWRPLPASYLPVTEVTTSTYEVVAKDAVLHVVAPCVVTLPDPSTLAGLRRISVTHAGGTGTVDLYCATYGIQGEETFKLVKAGETLTVQSVVTAAATTWVTQ